MLRIERERLRSSSQKATIRAQSTRCSSFSPTALIVSKVTKSYKHLEQYLTPNCHYLRALHILTHLIFLTTP